MSLQRQFNKCGDPTLKKKPKEAKNSDTLESNARKADSYRAARRNKLRK